MPWDADRLTDLEVNEYLSALVPKEVAEDG